MSSAREHPVACRLIVTCCVAIGAVVVTSAQSGSQQRTFPLRGGGTGLFLDGSADHTMIVRRGPDGSLQRECIRGDHHAAARILRSTARGAQPPEGPQNAARPGMAPAARQAVVTANMRFDPDVATGVDDDGRVLLYMPKPIEPGSSGSHFDRRASPDLLMKPSNSDGLAFDDVDLTDDALRDMGWRPGTFESQVLFTDAAGTGFDDPERGPARVAAMQFMLGVWEELLGSQTTVIVDASFTEQFCSESDGAVLGSAGPRFSYDGFAGGMPGVLYPGPMAESIARAEIGNAGDADIIIRFNSSIDDGCLGDGRSYYYGIDGDVPPGQVAFVPVALHEMAHGLGFLGLTEPSTGSFLRGLPDILATMTFDNRLGKTWDELSKPARRKSARRDGEVAFTGDKTQRSAASLLRGAHVLQITAPGNLTGTHIVGRAAFGPALDERRREQRSRTRG